MKCLGLIAVALALAAVTVPSPVRAQAPSHDRASGHGGPEFTPGSTCTDEDLRVLLGFEFGCCERPGGRRTPPGSLHVFLSTVEHSFSADGPVSCLAVTGQPGGYRRGQRTS